MGVWELSDWQDRWVWCAVWGRSETAASLHNLIRIQTLGVFPSLPSTIFLLPFKSPLSPIVSSCSHSILLSRPTLPSPCLHRWWIVILPRVVCAPSGGSNLRPPDSPSAEPKPNFSSLPSLTDIHPSLSLLFLSIPQMSGNRILPQNVPVEYTNDVKRSSSDVESAGLHDDLKHPDGEPAGINAVGHINIYDDVSSGDDDSIKNVNAGVRKVQQAQAVWGKVSADPVQTGEGGGREEGRGSFI